MKGINWCVLLLVFSKAIYGQNLVPNPSFEENSSIPDFINQVCRIDYWTPLHESCEPHIEGIGSPDYFHIDATGLVSLPNNNVFPNLYPNTGDAVVGLTLWHENSPFFREYISVELTEALTAGEVYQVCFNFSNGENIFNSAGGYGTNNLGIHFSLENLTQNFSEVINVEPQFESDTILYSNEWQKVSFEVVPDLPYKYLTIGNFRSGDNTNVQQFEANARSAYYFIDDVCIARLGEECTLLNDLDESLEINVGKVLVYPNPANIKLSVHFDKTIPTEFSLSSVEGKHIVSFNLSDVAPRGKYDFILPNLNSGVYLLVFIYPNGLKNVQKIIIMH